MSISERLKLLRENLGLTQALMANDLGIDRSHVGNIENASKKPSDSLVKHICLRYGVSESWLRDGEGEMFISPEERIRSLVEQLNHQPSTSSYYSYLVEHGLPLQEDLPEHLKAQAELLERKKEAIRKDFEARWEKGQSVMANGQETAELTHSFNQQLPDHKTDQGELAEMKKILEDLYLAGTPYWEWAKIQFRHAFPEKVVNQARTQLKSDQ
ncbi:helix-turn-helix domain-containing protein [Desulforamulus ferrireducens]|uniref:HTH cro/C1-type domain-containing protein n=1 Tax=Desulforamulus ferrireducens TaxID=1833852 RepID=A0A1S6IU98_9FIRM|nr:helix-turn-helix transcriptional regulator [Desulforamulus ferrireducens]AQS58337.1 hypothetical protein B0537_04055 [Desulforamulus ferrireducens]